MARLGYARVSTDDQDLSIQIETLKAAGCEIVRSEKMTGTTTEGRKELETILDFIRADDVLAIAKRLNIARSSVYRAISG